MAPEVFFTLYYVCTRSEGGHAPVCMLELQEMKTRRSAVPETWLARTCQFMTNKVRASMPQQQRTALVVRDLAETLQLAALSAGVQGSRQENLPGTKASLGDINRECVGEGWERGRSRAGRTLMLVLLW